VFGLKNRDYWTYARRDAAVTASRRESFKVFASSEADLLHVGVVLGLEGFAAWSLAFGDADAVVDG
jgi:hypothetical protein